MRGTDDSTGHAALYEIDVLRCNRRSIDVFRRCKLGYVNNGMGATCIGISATEITSAMNGMGVPQQRRKRVMSDVSFMGDVVAHWINDKNRKAS